MHQIKYGVTLNMVYLICKKNNFLFDGYSAWHF